MAKMECVASFVLISDGSNDFKLVNYNNSFNTKSFMQVWGILLMIFEQY